MTHIRSRWLVIAAVVPLLLAIVCVVAGLKTGLQYIAFHVAAILLAVTGAGAVCLLSIRFGQKALHFWREGKTARSGLWLVGGIVLLFFAIVVGVVTAIGALQHGEMRAKTFAARGAAWFHKGELDKAIADYTEAIRLDSNLAVAFNNRGQAWSRLGKYDKALADFDEAIRLDPMAAGAFNNRGLAWFQKKGQVVDRAFADYDEAIRLDPKRAEPFSNRGLAWLHKGQFDKAIADCSEAIRLNPKLAEAFNNRGGAWDNKGEYDKAIADCTEAIRLDPKNAGAFHNRGFAWFRKGQLGRAFADYDEAIRLGPKLAAAFAYRGDLWCETGEYDKAISDYTEASRLDPKNPNARYKRGLAWLAKKDCDKALSDLSEAIRLNPKFAQAFNNQAWIAATCPDVKYRDGRKAVENATKACELTGWKDWNNLNTLAAAYAEAGDFPNAVKWEDKAIDLAPDKWKGKLRSLLDLYKAKKPYRVEVTK